MKNFSAAVNLFLNSAQYSRGLKGAANATRGFASDLKSTFAKVGGGLALGFGIKEIGQAIFEQTKIIESLDFSYQNVIASSDEMVKRQQELAEIAEINGVSINELTKQYVGFAAATKDTAIEGDKAMYIFSTMNSVMGKLGSSADANRRALLAVQQMMNKGKVSAEELRQQLGEALPGAFNAFADALGVSQKELDKMLQAGTIISEDALPKFATQLEKIYGKPERINTLSASVERLKTTITEVVRAIDAGDVFRDLIDGTNEFAQALFGIGKAKESMDDIDKAIVNTTSFLRDLWEVAKDTVKEIIMVAEDLLNAFMILPALKLIGGGLKSIFQSAADDIRAAKDPLEEYNKTLEKTTQRTAGLFDKVKTLEKGSAEYEGALQVLTAAEYGIIKAHTDTETGVLNVAKAYEEYMNKMQTITRDKLLEEKLADLKRAFDATGKSAEDTARYTKLVAEAKAAFAKIETTPLIDRDKKPIVDRNAETVIDNDKALKDAIDKRKSMMNEMSAVVNEGYAARLKSVTKGGEDEKELERSTDAKLLTIEEQYWIDVLALTKKYGGDVGGAMLDLSKTKVDIAKNILAAPELMKGKSQVEIPGLIVEPKKTKIDITSDTIDQDALNENLNAMIEGFSMDIFASFFESIGGLIKGNDDAWAEFGKNALGSVGSFLQSMGAALITYGWLVKAFQNAFENPTTALIVGAAAFAAGSVLVGLANAGPSGMAGSSSAGSSGGGYMPHDVNTDNKVVFEIKGDKLVGVLDNYGKKTANTR